MPDITAPRIGHFCWYELATTDQQAAKSFYGKLFGWTSVDHPMGPGQVYTMFQLQGRNVGACYTLDAERRKQGEPVHWTTYVAVANADATADKARELGAEIIGPFDVFDAGRMAIVKDPTGAIICVWQANKHIGVEVAGEPNTVCWSELLTPDTDKAKAFYTALFGWGAYVGAPSPIVYTHWQVNGQDHGGMMAITKEMGNFPAHWSNYVSVADCDATVARTIELGGRVCKPATDIPNTGRFAVLQDPQGAVFCVIALMPMEHKSR